MHGRDAQVRTRRTPHMGTRNRPETTAPHAGQAQAPRGRQECRPFQLAGWRGQQIALDELDELGDHAWPGVPRRRSLGLLSPPPLPVSAAVEWVPLGSRKRRRQGAAWARRALASPNLSPRLRCFLLGESKQSCVLKRSSQIKTVWTASELRCRKRN